MIEEDKCKDCVYNLAHSHLCATCDPTSKTDFSYFRADNVVPICMNCEQLRDELETVKTERNVLAMLSSDTPRFFNPFGLFAAKNLRDDILKGLGLKDNNAQEKRE